jgi:hypothetical protein
MWPAIWVSSEPEIHELLVRWHGSMAQAWAYSVSHGQFLLRLHRGAPRSLFVYCKACHQVRFESHWQDSAITLSAGPAHQFTLADREYLNVSCLAVFVAETENYDVQFPMGA